MSHIQGNKAIKIPNDRLDLNLDENLMSPEGYVYLGILNKCEGELAKLSEFKNIDILEYQSLFNQRCAKYEKLFFNNLRSKMREKMYHDQIKDFSSDYSEVYHPYNPYLQKYSGAYLRTYQQF